ncbi:MAG: hypothetical protein QM496_11535 [Verrucomicrobiota bacterium]
MYLDRQALKSDHSPKIKRRKKANQEWETLASVYRDAPVSSAYSDTDLRYISGNKWLSTIYSISVEDHLGQTIGELLPTVAENVEKNLAT